MKCIDTFAEYSDLIGTYRQKHKSKYHNNFMMRDEVDQFIRERRLYLFDTEASLVFGVLKNDAFMLYFSCEKDALKLPLIDKPMCLDYVSRKGRARDLPIIQDFMQSGFEMIAENQEYMLKNEGAIDRNFPGCIFSNIQENEMEVVRHIWLTSLDNRSNPIPAHDEMMRTKASIYVLKKNEEVLAAVHLPINGSRAMIEHLAVSKKHRGQGMGQILFAHALSVLEGKTVTLWVNRLNREAIRLYEKNGFQQTNKNAIQLMKESRL